MGYNHNLRAARIAGSFQIYQQSVSECEPTRGEPPLSGVEVDACFGGVITLLGGKLQPQVSSLKSEFVPSRTVMTTASPD